MTLVIGFRAHSDNPEWSRLRTVNLIICAKTSFPNKVTRFQRFGHGHIFLGATIQPITLWIYGCLCLRVCVGVYYAKEQSVSKALVNTCCQGDTVWKHNDKRERRRPCPRGDQSLLGTQKSSYSLKSENVGWGKIIPWLYITGSFTLSVVVKCYM